MGTPTKLPYPVPEKRRINEFHRVISPGKSETKNSKRRIEKSPEDNNIKKIKVEENCISIDLLEPTVMIEEHAMKQETEDHCDKNNLFLGKNLTPNNFKEGKNEKNVENQEKEDCKLERFDKEGLILSKSDDKIGQLFQCALCEKKFSYNVIWYNSKPTLMKHILKSHEKEVSKEILETKSILEKHDSNSRKQKTTSESFQDVKNQTNKNCSNGHRHHSHCNHSKVKTKFENKQDLVSKVSKNQLIFCLTCGDDFSDFEQLSKHIEIKIECRSSLNQVQLKKKFGSNYAVCPKKPTSSKPENNEDQFVIQYKNKITGTTMYKCSICDTISYQSKSTLTKHISQSHYGQKSLNPLWQKTSSGSIKVFRQAQRIFEKEKLINYSYDKKVGPLYKCTMCGVAYNNKSSVVAHIKKYHDGLKIIEKILLQEKELLVKKKPHKCSECDNSFSQKSNLKKHMEKNHTLSLPSEVMVAYKCASCDMTFSEKSNLIQHLRQHIAKTPDSDSDIIEKSEAEVVVKEELNSIVDIDDDFLQNFDDLQNVAIDPLAT